MATAGDGIFLPTSLHFTETTNISSTMLSSWTSRPHTTELWTGTIIPANTTANQTISSPQIHTDVGTITMTVILFITLIIGLVGNSLVLIAIGRTRSLRRTNNTLILSLAVTDLFASAAIMPFFILQVSQRFLFIYIQFFRYLEKCFHITINGLMQKR